MFQNEELWRGLRDGSGYTVLAPNEAAFDKLDDNSIDTIVSCLGAPSLLQVQMVASWGGVRAGGAWWAAGVVGLRPSRAHAEGDRAVVVPLAPVLLFLGPHVEAAQHQKKTFGPEQNQPAAPRV